LEKTLLLAPIPPPASYCPGGIMRQPGRADNPVTPARAALFDLAPGQLVPVVEEMAQLGAGDGGEAASRGVVGLALELDRADIPAAGVGGEPALDQRQEAGRVANDVREEPVDRPDRVRVERKGALLPVLDPR